MIIRLLTLITLFMSAFLHADLDPSVNFPNQGPYQPPENPTTPPPTVTDESGNVLIPVMLRNNSGLSNTEVYVVVLGNVPNTATPAFVQFEEKDGVNGVGTLVAVLDGDDGKNYSEPISFFHQTDGTYVAYVPFVESGRIYISFDRKLDMPVSGGAITEPSGTGTGPSELDNYNSIWDWIEFNYQAAVPQLFPNTTSVDQVNIPLYLYLHVPDPSSQCNVGFFQPRSYILDTIQAAFNAAPASADWNQLFLQSTVSTDIVRIIAPQDSIALGTAFDPNYYDKSSGFSYLDFLWGGATPYYETGTNDLFITIPSGEAGDTNLTYRGNVDGSKNFVFQNTVSTKQVSFDPPNNSGPNPQDNTTFNIFAAEVLPNTQSGGITSDDVVQINKFLTQLIVIGFVPQPTTSGDPITLPGIVADQNNYYPINTNLPVSGQTSGPWYSLWSKAIHDIAMQFSYPYDDALWPQTQLAAPSVTAENQNFIAITIGPKDLIPTNTSLSSSENPSTVGDSVTFTAIVTSQSTITTETPTGTVVFTIDGVDQPAEPLDGSGQATFTTNSLTEGSHTIGATYSGDVTFQSSETNPDFEQIVESGSKLDTQTELESDPTTTTQGENVKFTATVLDGASTPNGLVEFNFFNLDTSIPSQTVSLDGSGVAILNKSDLPVGKTAVRAVYQGNDTFNASASNFVVQTVNEPGKLSTTTEVNGEPNPANPGVTVTFTAIVTPQPSSEQPPLTGTVTFFVDGEFTEDVPLNNGQATYSTNTLPVGKHIILASYSGNSDYSGSSSETTEQIVDNEFPPKNARGFQKKNKFASQTEYVNKLIWFNPNTTPLPIRFDVYRDINLSVFVASVGGSSNLNKEFTYFDRWRQPKTTYRYYVVAVYEGGEISLPVEIVIN